MQGQPDRDNSRFLDERQTEARLAALRATHKHRAYSPTPPQRPPGMARLEEAPETPRVPRPSRAPQNPKRRRRRRIILGAIFAVAIIFACTVAFQLTNGIIQSSGPAVTAVNFLSALDDQNYAEAYEQLGPAITIRINQQVFLRQAEDIDKHYGKVTDYQQVAGSAVVEDNKHSYTYKITREKLKEPYEMRITLQEIPNEGWKVTDYGTTLGPTQ